MKIKASILIACITFALNWTVFAHADIYQWEWLDDGYQTQPSTTLTPSGAGVSAVPGADLANLDLTMAYLGNANLNSANLNDSNLSRADVNQANLTNANLSGVSFSEANISGANFTGADVRGANFFYFWDDFYGVANPALTSQQLYSTASYQNHDLVGIRLQALDLTGWDFSNQDLTGAVFVYADIFEFSPYPSKLTNANFAGATIKDAWLSATTNYGFTESQFYSTESYQTGDLRGVNLGYNDLTSWNFAGKNLEGASFNLEDWGGSNLTSANFSYANLYGVDISSSNLTNANLSSAVLTNAVGYEANLSNANLSNANLTDADMSGVSFSGAVLSGANVKGASFARFSNGVTTYGGLSAAQLYSTSSYQAKDLSGVGFYSNELSGFNFREQTLRAADFERANASNVDFTDADLTEASFYLTTIANANFTGSDIRGASFRDTTSRGFTSVQLYSTASYQNGDLTGINLRNNNLTGWNFTGNNLTNSDFRNAVLTNAHFDQTNLSGANFEATDLTSLSFLGAVLTNTNLRSATLTGASLAGADVRFANLEATTSKGFTAAQLYSTVSYLNKDISGIILRNNNLAGWNFSGLNLSGADLSQSTLTNTDFSDADIKGTDLGRTTSKGFTAAQLYSTASYQEHNLSGAKFVANNLTGWNFSNQTLDNTVFSLATLTNADFTGADVRGANFFLTSSTFTPSQLYSTASYQNYDLSEIQLRQNNLDGWNFAGQKLVNTNFFASTLINADLTAADMRGAYAANIGTAIVTNLIRSDGTILSLDISGGRRLVVRDYDGGAHPGSTGTPNPAYPVHVKQSAVMDSSSVLELRFEADEWNSTISFDAGISVILAGTLKLEFADDVSITSQIGRTIDLFDWTGVSPTGTFMIDSSYTWDLTNLYTTGEVKLLAASILPADYDLDGDVDGRDFLAWQYDANVGDLADWQNNYGVGSLTAASLAVPEPSAIGLLLLATSATLLRRSVVT